MTKHQTFILLDRSGSMSNIWQETLSGLDHFVKELGKTTKTRVTLAGFDSVSFDVPREGVKPKNWSPVTEMEPRSMTPLFDAIGRMNALVALAKPKRATIIVITDGHENASLELSRAGAGKVIEKWKEKGFDVTFLGANFDNFGQASDLGVAAGQTMSYDTVNTKAVMSGHAARSAAYASTGTVADFTDEDRKAAKK